MSKKARRRPTWKYNKRKIPRKHQTARYTLPYLKYWTVGFYQWFDTIMAEQYMAMPENRKLFVSEYQADIMRKILFNGT